MKNNRENGNKGYGFHQTFIIYIHAFFYRFAMKSQ